jgi:hypothetical protein
VGNGGQGEKKQNPSLRGRLGLWERVFQIKRHSRSASERESRLFLRNTGSPIKAFGDDEKNPVKPIK